jgi:hypothetical protein
VEKFSRARAVPHPGAEPAPSMIAPESGLPRGNLLPKHGLSRFIAPFPAVSTTLMP